jgi:CheY-like chemotaxis protein
MPLVTTRGTDALELVERFKPAALTLDPGLTDIDGWLLLEQLKRDFATRHIPVQIISIDDDRTRGLLYGAFDYLLKPFTADEIQNALVGIVAFSRCKTRSQLLVDGDEGSRARLLDLLGNTVDRSQKIQLVRSGGDEGTHQHAGRGIHHRQRTAQRNEIDDIAATRLTRMALKCHGRALRTGQPGSVYFNLRSPRDRTINRADGIIANCL